MFMRTVHLKLDPNRLLELREMYNAVIVAALSRMRGCRFAGLLQSVERPETGLSLTLWDSAEAAATYEKSGAYMKLWEQSKPYLAAFPEGAVHLNDDLQLELSTADQEPEISRYATAVDPEPSAFVPPGKGRLYLRVVSLHVRAGKLEEFRSLYKSVIVPGLRRVPGCRSAFLTGADKDARELTSVTIWNSRADAEEYEQHGGFPDLLARVSHTLEDSSGWKAGGARVERVIGSDDLTVTGYALVTGQVFDAAG